MAEFDSIEEVAVEIKNNLDSHTNKKQIAIMYAFNSTGKTRVSNEFIKLDDENESTNIKVLCFNALLEDLFKWDNDEFILEFNSNSWEAKIIKDEGMDKKIIDNFKKILNTKIEPSFDLINGKLTFNIPTEDKGSTDNIKISRGEESVLIWSVFYTILKTAIEELNISEVDNRSTKIFNELEYVIIDDPVSSIDDNRLITMALDLIELIKGSNNNKLKFLITTHHALFYNVLFNSFKKNKEYRYILSKDGTKLKLEHQGDSPFGYHFVVKDEIQNAINTNNIKKYHFNLFRSLLEKTANFLGYDDWSECIVGDNKPECVKLLQLNSHSRLSELEYKELSNDEKFLFQEAFNKFIKEFKWKVEQNAG